MKIKSAYIGLLLIAIMLISTFAFAALQQVSIAPEEETELPKSNILDQELTMQQESALIQNSKTIIKFYYNLMCGNCLEQKSYLEQVASSQQFGDQIVLVELISKEGVLPKITVVSMNGQKTKTNATQDEIIDILCGLVVNQPILCALRKV